MCLQKTEPGLKSPEYKVTYIINGGREPGPHLSLQTWQWPVNKAKLFYVYMCTNTIDDRADQDTEMMARICSQWGICMMENLLHKELMLNREWAFA